MPGSTSTPRSGRATTGHCIRSPVPDSSQAQCAKTQPTVRLDTYQPRGRARTLEPRDEKAQVESMPFVNIRILKGHPQQRKDEIARLVTEAISEVAELPKHAIWVVFEDIAA